MYTVLAIYKAVRINACLIINCIIYFLGFVPMNYIPKMIAVAKNRIIRIYKLLLIDSSKGVGYITALKPKIPSILKILEPTTFPTAISLFFFIAATTGS